MQFTTENVQQTARVLRNDAAGNKQATMTDMDLAASMLETLAQERDELARWKELVSNGSMLQALRDKAERERDELRAALEALLKHEGTVVETGIGMMESEELQQARAQAAAVLAKITDTGPRYTSASKGGSYIKLGAIRGAGALKGLAGIAYQNEKGDLFIREPECFAKRMVLVEQPWNSNNPVTREVIEQAAAEPIPVIGLNKAQNLSNAHASRDELIRRLEAAEALAAGRIEQIPTDAKMVAVFADIRLEHKPYAEELAEAIKKRCTSGRWTLVVFLPSEASMQALDADAMRAAGWVREGGAA